MYGFYSEFDDIFCNCIKIPELPEMVLKWIDAYKNKYEIYLQQST